MSLPTFTCPKCGAVADLAFRAGVTQEAVDKFAAVVANRKPSAYASMGMFYDHERLRQMQQDAERGDRLEASCPRCKHTWQEKPLDAAPSGPTPIYDGLTDEVSPYQPPKSLGFMAWAMGA